MSTDPTPTSRAAEVLAEHRCDEVTRDCIPVDGGGMAWVYARRCDCGWHGPSDQHDAHLAQALADAGLLRQQEPTQALTEAEREAVRDLLDLHVLADDETPVWTLFASVKADAYAAGLAATTPEATGRDGGLV